ncbi:MAG: MarR family transcriptional regulator [Actinomycetota bacterium]|nr:MarR family transcriptional regulator [Actinomycetota bacterium]
MGVREDAGVAAWRAMLLAYNAAVRAIDAELDQAGAMPLTWYDVLLELNATSEGKLRMRELANRVVLSRTRVSRLVDEMAGAGLVDKIRDETDRRVVWASITSKGKREFRTTAPLYLRGIESQFAAYLTPDEKAMLVTALTKVTSAHVSCTPDLKASQGRTSR